MKRIIALALAACLAAACLSGCGANSGGGTRAMGRYVEQQGETLDAERVYDLRLDGAGNLVFYTRRLTGSGTVVERCVLPTGGGGLERSQVEWLSGKGAVKPSESEDGWVYAIIQDEAYNNALWRCAPGGQPEQVEMPQWGGGMEFYGVAGSGSVTIGGSVTVDGAGSGEAVQMEPGTAGDESGAAVAGDGFDLSYFAPDGQESKYPYGVRALSGGDFLICYGEAGVSRYSGDGTLTNEFAGSTFQGTAVNGSTLVVGGSDGKGFWSYDLDTGKSGPAYTYESLSPSVALGMDAEGIYLGDASGIYRQAVGGSVWEKLVDGELTSLSMPSVALEGLVSDGGDGFWAILSGEDEYRLVHYIYDPDTPTAPDTELTIFGLTENKTVAQAIGEFQRHNPNVRINYRVGMDEGSAATAEEVIRALNTELVAGKGPDLLLLDGLPVDSYIEKGVLSDLTQLVSGLDGMMTNLLGAYEREGKVYGVPSRFTLPVMMGRADDVSAVRSLSDLAALVEARQGEAVPFLFRPSSLWGEGGMLMNWYSACAGDFTGGGVDQEALSNYLALMKTINDEVRANAPQIGDGMAADVVISVSSSGSGGYEVLDSGARSLGQNLALFHVQELSGRFGLESLLGALADKEGYALDTLFGGDRYTPVGGVGIVSASGQQELAREFIQMLLSPTVQDRYLYDGFPVNESSLEKMAAEATENAEERGDMGFLELCRKVKTPILADQVVKDAVESQAKGLADGTVTPEQAAAAVVEKTKLYLTE